MAVIVAELAWFVAQAHADDLPSDATTDAQLEKLAEQEAIEIYDERPDKPFDRDTEVRLTGEELAKRGAVDLKTALALIPDVVVRDAGRGGFQIDIRGARKGEVSILVDGVLVSDPYYGTFDVSTIPITDIVQIRISTTPQSPIDGPGGPGGVVEVHTRDAIGEQLVIARVTSDTLPTFGITATARTALAPHLALRLSGSGIGGARELPLPDDATIGEGRHSATGSARLEYREGNRRVVADAFLDDRHYLSPPADELLPGGNKLPVLLIDRETSARAGVKADEKRGKLQLQAQAYVAYLHRRSRFFQDADLDTQLRYENLRAWRTGAMALATRPFHKEWRWAASATMNRESADVSDRSTRTQGDVTILEAAGDLQFERRRVRIDAAGGVAVPFGVGADPWLEAKLVARYQPVQRVELVASVGRKGRVPSLRERYDAQVGNPALGPEIANYGELRSIARADRLRIEIAPFYRRSTGTIHSLGGPTGPMLVNSGQLDIYGVDAMASLRVHRMVELGGAYDYLKALGDTLPDGTRNPEPLDFLAHHRAEGSIRFEPNPRVSAIARLKYVGRTRDSGQIIPANTLVEASISAQLSRDYTLLGRVDDLLDRKPETRAGYHGAGRVISLILQGTWD